MNDHARVWRIVPLLLAIPALFTAKELVSMVRAPQPARVELQLPANATVDIVMLTPRAREHAVFLGAELYPRDVRFFDSWEAWRARERAKFMNDARAVNAPPGPPPARGDVILAIDEEGRVARR